MVLLFCHDVHVGKNGFLTLVCIREGAEGGNVILRVMGLPLFVFHSNVKNTAKIRGIVRVDEADRQVVERCRGTPDMSVIRVYTYVMRDNFSRDRAVDALHSQGARVWCDRDPVINGLLSLNGAVHAGAWFELDNEHVENGSSEAFAKPETFKGRPDLRGIPESLTIHSFDVETTGLDGTHPDAKVLMIGAAEGRRGMKDADREIVWVARAKRDDAPAWFRERFPNVDVRWFEDEEGCSAEEKLLADWRAQIHKCHVLTGFNSEAFDIPYLWHRTPEGQKQFGSLPVQSGCRTLNTSSKQQGTMEVQKVDTPGLLHVDIRRMAQNSLKLPTYSLNSVSAHVLGEDETKEDVKHTEIVPFFNSDDPEKFWKLVAYQVIDARLPWRLIHAMNAYDYVLGFTRMTPIPPSYVLGRGQMVNVFAKMRAYVSEHRPGMLLSAPYVPWGQQPTQDFTYKGGCVLRPRMGVYPKGTHVDIHDFMSLYPSILSGNNLSFETVLEGEDAVKVALAAGHEVAVYHIGEGDMAFFLQDVPGVLPDVIEELLGQRRAAKADLKRAKDPLDKKYYDVKQLALKVFANSIYGFTGATIAPIFEPLIARSITSVGRNMIECTRDRMEDGEGGVIVYGDTDSVMLHGPQHPTWEEHEAYAAWVALRYTAMHTRPHVLEDEGITDGAVFTACQKTYCYFNRKTGDVTRKGLETDKREYPPAVKTLAKRMWNAALERPGPEVEGVVRACLAEFDGGLRSFPIEDWAVSVKYNRTEKTKPAHVQLAERAAVDTPDVAPHLGERFQYVVCVPPKGSPTDLPLADRMQLLAVAKDKGLIPDIGYYWESKFKRPIQRLLRAVGVK